MGMGCLLRIRRGKARRGCECLVFTAHASRGGTSVDKKGEAGNQEGTKRGGGESR